ncbi:glutathione binding-like protein, partial [Guyparkeria sp. 1SP6A2]|nr:glutathione binding-like protein [Guyparkeria sp. 1SP6A2]
AILPLLLQMFVAKDGCQTNFLKGYADHEAAQVMRYFDQSLAGKTYLVAEQLTGADIIISFIAEILVKDGVIEHYPNIARYLRQLA